MEAVHARGSARHLFTDTLFTPQRGTWGLQGIVAIRERAKTYIFFVTFGQEQAGHAFDESITDDGVLTWQSQPRQRLTDPTIRNLIEHDDRIDAIHVFLRPRRPSATP